LSRYIYSWKRQCQCSRGVDTCSGEEGAHVTDSWVACRVTIREEDDIADDTGERRCHDEDVSALESFGGDGVEDCEARR
jgi:hypothetical protein